MVAFIFVLLMCHLNFWDVSCPWVETCNVWNMVVDVVVPRVNGKQWKQKQMQGFKKLKILPASSKWPLDLPNRGHLAPEKAT